jgi:hypothetical protein
VTTENKRQLPVVDVDQAFPLLTIDGAATRTASTALAADQAPTVASAIRDVLGWRPCSQDTKAFTAALTAAFELHTVEGHVEARHIARGVAMQADLGGITGGQASLYWRAKSAHEQITRMLESLQPLRPDADPEDCAAFRALVRDTTRQIVQELGLPGGPRVELVDSAFRALTGFEPTTGGGFVVVAGTDVTDPVIGRSARRGAFPYLPPPALLPAAGTSVDDVPGILGALRERFGLTDDQVNTVDEEKIRTSFLTLVDLIIDLQRSWDQQRVAFGDDVGRGFLGTELILINRLLAAAAEQVDELETVLDSALVSSAERQTIVIEPATRLTLDGLLTWLRTFLTEDGPRTVQDTGRDGITTWFTPTVLTLLKSVRDNLVAKLPVGTGPGDRSPISLLPVGCCSPLPAGMHAARTRIAISGLCSLLEQLARNAARIGRFSGIVLFDVLASPFIGQGAANRQFHFVRVEVRGLHLRPTYLPAFVRRDTRGRELEDLVLPVQGSATADTDSMIAVFRAEDLRALNAAGGLGTFGGVPDGQTFTIPASALPLAVVDGETGRVVVAPPVRIWPSLARADRATAFEIPDNIGEEAQVFAGFPDVPDGGVADLPDDCVEPCGCDNEVEQGERLPADQATAPGLGGPSGAGSRGNGLGMSGADRLSAAQERVREAEDRRTAADEALRAERHRSDVMRQQREEIAADVLALTERLRLADGLLAERTAHEDQALAELRAAETRTRGARDEEQSARLLADAEGRASRGTPEGADSGGAKGTTGNGADGDADADSAKGGRSGRGRNPAKTRAKRQ